jgi:HlyD family secretion protein
MQVTVNEEGKTRIRQRYIISAPVSGQLRRIPFKAGAVVKAGDPVVAVEPGLPTLLDIRAHNLAEARRDSASANLEKARTAHDFAANELRRFEKLYADKTVSVHELEGYQLRETSAAKDVAAAEGALRQAEAELAEFTQPNEVGTNAPDPLREVNSPVNGQVLRVFEENARVVLAGTPLLEVGDPTDLEIVVEVLSRDGASVTPGARVELEQWGSTDAKVLPGRVRLVEPAAFTKVSALGVEEQRVNVIADLLTPPSQRTSLGDAFRVEARIVVWETPQTLKVPTGALFRRGEQWAVFVDAGSRAELRQVKAGRSSGTETQILEGLKDGEQVILYPGNRVREGQRIRAVSL